MKATEDIMSIHAGLEPGDISASDTLRMEIKTLESKLEDAKKRIDDLVFKQEQMLFNTVSQMGFSQKFDAETKAGTSFALVYRGAGGTNKNYVGVRSGGVFIGSTAAAEKTGSEFDFYPNSFGITATTYGWIDVDIAAATWTMNTGASVPAAATGHEVVRLFKIVWDTDRIDSENVIIYHTGDVVVSGVVIRWNNESSVKLEYSVDGGVTWVNIDTAVEGVAA